MEEKTPALGAKTKERCALLYEWTEAITIAFAVVVLIFAFVCRLISVDGTSMMDTLYDEERLLLSRLPYTPDYGAIVVILLEGRDEPLIKRIIALEGDTVQVNAETGEVYRNGILLEESYIHVPTAVEQMRGVVTVPEGEVFVMGDNRSSGHSLDSRSFGCIPESDIMGKAVFRLFPLERFGGIYDKS